MTRKLPFQKQIKNSYFSSLTNGVHYNPSSVWSTGSFREDGFRCFHLRTFRRWLWDYIDPKGFLRPDGNFFHASGDSAFIFPMLELLGDPKHVAFIDTPLYVYRLYEGNVHNYDKKSQTDDLEYIRFHLKKYPPLDRQILRVKCAG